MDRIRRDLLLVMVALAFGACGGGDPQGIAKEGVSPGAVKEYLLKHPEIVLDDAEISTAIDRARVERREAISASLRRAVLEEAADVVSSPLTPTAGDPDSRVRLIEFYDYQCAPCKAGFAEFEEMQASEADVQVVYAQLPIFGSHSVMAARAVLAAQRQGLFEPYHEALMTVDSRLDMDLIYAKAVESGLDLEQLKLDMRDPVVLAYLEEVRALAEALEVTGTPAFVIGDAIVRGGATADDLRAELDLQRVRLDAPST
ncbi:MAG: DsbA family protein [Proteobacteria bacterium TMED72]|nr:MAG: DsbA family protein [Proteobacteria bacterium TMED72]